MTIVGFEDQYPEALKTALFALFPEAEIEIGEEYDRILIDALSPDFVVTDMMMPTSIKSRDIEYAGVAVMLRCMDKDIPAVCISSLYHHDPRCNFGNHLLRQAGLEMVDEVDKDIPKAWIEALRKSFRGHHDHWTHRPRTSIRSAIQEYVPQEA